jgi:hypothetical protein
MASTYEKDCRVTALDMALELQKERCDIDNKLVNAALVTADATIFYRFLTKIPEGFAPATG